MSLTSFLLNLMYLYFFREDLGYLQKSQAQPIDGNTGFHFFQFPASVTMQSLSPILSTVSSMDDGT